MNIKELRQLQAALKNTEGVTFARKAPKQLGLFVDFKGHEFRVEYFESHKEWRVTRGLGEFPGGSELATLIPIVLRCQQDKEMEAELEAEAAKVKAEEDRKTAIAHAKAEAAKTKELRDYCRLTVTPGFDRQSWCENQFGFNKWNINELNRQELEILSAEIKRRVGDVAIAAPAPGVEEVECMDEFLCPGCDRTVPWSEGCDDKYPDLCDDCAYEEMKKEEAIADSPSGCMDENSSIEERVGDEIEEEATSETPSNSSGMDEKSCMDEGADCEEMVTALNQIFEEDWSIFAAIIGNNLISVMFYDTDENFLVSRENGKGWYLEESDEEYEGWSLPKSEGWSLRFNICKEALSQAFQSIISRKQKHAEALRMAPEQAAELMRRSKSGDEEADKIILDAMNESLGARCDEAFEPVETLTFVAKGKALTLKQPWAWAIFNCGKNIENRSWDTSYRGRLFIHAGQAYDHSAAAWIAQKFGVEVPGPGDLPSGAIIGWVVLGSVTQNALKPNLFPWAIEGQYHWYLKNPQSCEPIPWKGQLGLFEVAQ